MNVGRQGRIYRKKIAQKSGEIHKMCGGMGEDAGTSVIA
jgi:hypothetical protein